MNIEKMIERCRALGADAPEVYRTTPELYRLVRSLVHNDTLVEMTEDLTQGLTEDRRQIGIISDTKCLVWLPHKFDVGVDIKMFVDEENN